jgi:hypothetical protein
LARLTELRRRWIEVQPTAVLRELAEMALQRHPLRAGLRPIRQLQTLPLKRAKGHVWQIFCM